MNGMNVCECRRTGSRDVCYFTLHPLGFLNYQGIQLLIRTRFCPPALRDIKPNISFS
ncbi:hypothetical protein Hanom_Chr16g01512101 [Helianthus anomalus]